MQPDTPPPTLAEAVSLLSIPFPPTTPLTDLLHRTHRPLHTADISNLQAVRSSLHPLTHFLPYLSTLHASLAVVQNDSPLIPYLLADFRSLIAGTPPKYVPPVALVWVGLCRHAARLAIETHHISRAMSLINPLETACNKLAPTSDALVPIHADYLALCLEAKLYKLASRWLAQKRRAIHTETTITATDVHLIHHYSAMVLIGTKNFRLALQSCRLALAVPAPSPGPFFQAALSTYKLYILLHLLVLGAPPPPLKFSSYQPARMRKDASEYLELAYAFERMHVEKIHQLFESNKQLYLKHNNLGLVKQVIVELSKRLIIRLSKSFVTISLSDLARRASLQDEEATRIILELIHQNRLAATIDDQTGIIKLLDDDAIEEARIVKHLSPHHINHCLDIVKRIDQFREKLQFDPAYIKRELAAHQKKRPGPSFGGAGGTRLPPDLDSEFMK